MIWPRKPGGADDRVGGFGEREGVFVDLEPARKIAWLWKPVRGEKGIPPLVSIFILPVRGGSETTLLHAGFPGTLETDRLYGSCARVWEDGLAKLKFYLETGRTCKMEFVDFEAIRMLTRPRR